MTLPLRASTTAVLRISDAPRFSRMGATTNMPCLRATAATAVMMEPVTGCGGGSMSPTLPTCFCAKFSGSTARSVPRLPALSRYSSEVLRGEWPSAPPIESSATLTFPSPVGLGFGW